MKFTMLSSEEMKNFLRIFDRSQGGSFVNRFRVFDPRINNYTYFNHVRWRPFRNPVYGKSADAAALLLEGRNRQFDSGVKAVGV